MNKSKLLTEIEKEIKTCTKCPLCKTAINAVPGEGNVNSDIVFIGEAPGAKEDQTGRPFVGRAGMLLEKMLNRIGYSRKDVWIGNIIKHRPPNNRDPLPEEILMCKNYLTKQLEIIEPILIVTLGRFAMNYFYQEGKITIDRGKLLKSGKYNIYPVYHPAAALRNKKFAKEFVRDFMKIPDIMNKLKV